MNTWVQQFAELNGVTQPVNGSWIQAICEAEGITQPVNGTWIEALARNKGATEPYNGSWWAALAVALGINNVSNGTWIQALAENGLFLDADAEAFITAASITDQTQINAIDDMVKSLKSEGLFSKSYAIYPFVGGTSARHGLNLVNPATFQITWTVNPTHSSNGVTFNGTTQYGRTGLIPSTTLTLNNTALHVYNRRSPLTTTGVDMAGVNSSSQQLRMWSRFTSNAAYSFQYDGTNGSLLSPALVDNAGLFSMSRTASNSHVIYKKGISVASNATSGGTMPTAEIFIGVQSSSGSPAAGTYYSGTMQFAAITQGFSAAECLALETIVEQFQRDLSRPANGGNRITYEGNSFYTYGLGTEITNALSASSADSNTVTYAVGASAISSIIGSSNYMLDSARIAAVDARYRATAYRNVIVVFEGINELYYQLGVNPESASVANTVQAFQDYCTLQTAKGFKLVINTLTPRSGGGTPANYPTARLSVNTALRNIFNVSTGITRVFKSSNPTWANVILCDVGADSDFGQTGDDLDLTYYIDGTHPTALTVNLMADNYYAPAIQIL